MPTDLLSILFLRIQSRWHLRRSIGDLLSRVDDHLLDDIGLTRHQAEQLMIAPPGDDIPVAATPPLRAIGGMACTHR